MMTIAFAAATAELAAIPTLVTLGNEAAVVPRWRSLLSMSALGAAVALILASPIIQSRRVSHRAEADMIALASRHRATLVVEQAISRVNATIDRAHLVHSAGPSPTLLLQSLAAAMPDSAALVAWSMDSLQGNAVLVSGNVVESFRSSTLYPPLER